MKIERIERVLSTYWRSDWLPDDDRLPRWRKQRRRPPAGRPDSSDPAPDPTTEPNMATDVDKSATVNSRAESLLNSDALADHSVCCAGKPTALLHESTCVFMPGNAHRRPHATDDAATLYTQPEVADEQPTDVCDHLDVVA